MDELIKSFTLFQEKISREGYNIKNINKQMKTYMFQFSDILSKYQKHDINEISTYIEKQQELEDELCNARKKINQLEIELLDSRSIIDKSVKIGKDFVNKIKCVLSLRKTFKELLDTSGFIGGSLIRQLFELPVALSESFSTMGFGDPIGRDIDIYLYKCRYDCDVPFFSSKLQEKIKEMNNFIKFHKLSPHTFPAIKFGDYELVEITDSTLTELSDDDMIGKKKLYNIPHYLFILKDSANFQITIDVLGWKTESDFYWPNCDFDVNKLFISDSGINTPDDDFDDVINQIINKETKCIVELKLLHDTLSDILPKSEKRSKLNQLVFFLTNRMKIIGTGYKICGNNIPKIFIEEKEYCNISDMPPPYLSINLVCNHNISLMTFVGIINELNQYTEAIRCPYCRDSILMKFDNIEATEVISWIPTEQHIEVIPLTVQKSNEISLFSAESKEYITNILLKRQQLIPDPLPLPTVRVLRGVDTIARTSTRSTSNGVGYSFGS